MPYRSASSGRDSTVPGGRAIEMIWSRMCSNTCGAAWRVRSNWNLAAVGTVADGMGRLGACLDRHTGGAEALLMRWILRDFTRILLH
ncbi:hypothetical protein D9M70_594740 [compost metagenome]